MHMDKYCTVVVQMQRKPRVGANRTIHSHTYYTCEITTMGMKDTGTGKRVQLVFILFYFWQF